MYRPAWQHVLAIATGLLLALLIGWPFDHAGMFAAVFLGGVVVYEVRNLIRFEHWLRQRAHQPPPNMSGLWGEAIATAHRLYRRKVYHKRRVLSLLREFRRMTAAMPDGAILLGPMGEILWFNRKAGRWLDLRRKVDYGIRIDNLLRQPEFIEYFERRGQGVAPRLHMPKLSDHWFTFNLVTTNTWGLQLLIVRDVTNEARLENMRRDFVANASHELSSPLTVIGGYLDSLADDPALDQGWREPVREMQRQSDRMRGIIHDLLELSRLEAGPGDAEQIPVDVGGMLALMRREVLSRSEPRSQFTLELESDDLLLGTESELHSIFQNLISNAVKFTPPEGSVRVRWWTDDTGGHVSVADTGIGIPSSHISRLTERFYRVDAGRSRKMGGSGLGLAIVKHALHRHGGDLQIESEEGRGSTFSCHFPLARVARRSTAQA